MDKLFKENVIFNGEIGKVILFNDFFNPEMADFYFKYLFENIDWTADIAKIYGKTIITKRKISWHGDPGLDYNYSGSSRVASGWGDKIVLEIKNKLENNLGLVFNSCLLNLYHSGAEGMGWHSDDQNHLVPNSPVAIISFGAERFFKIRKFPEKDNIHKFPLPIGSVLLMSGQFQKHWQHELPKMMGLKTMRISLTFRVMLDKKAVI